MGSGGEQLCVGRPGVETTHPFGHQLGVRELLGPFHPIDDKREGIVGVGGVYGSECRGQEVVVHARQPGTCQYASLNIRLTRTPAAATFGIECCHVDCTVPPSTSRSPDAGLNRRDSPPATGRNRKRRLLPNDTMATTVSSL